MALLSWNTIITAHTGSPKDKRSQSGRACAIQTAGLICAQSLTHGRTLCGMPAAHAWPTPIRVLDAHPINFCNDMSTLRSQTDCMQRPCDSALYPLISSIAPNSGECYCRRPSTFILAVLAMLCYACYSMINQLPKSSTNVTRRSLHKQTNPLPTSSQPRKPDHPLFLVHTHPLKECRGATPKRAIICNIYQHNVGSAGATKLSLM